MWLDAEDNSSIVHTDGNVTRWKNKVSDQHDAVLASGNAKYLPNGLGDSSPAIDMTGGGLLKILDSNHSFDEWGMLTIGMVYKWKGVWNWNKAIWKGPHDPTQIVGYSISKMNVGAGQGTGFWYGSFDTSLRLNGSVLSEASHGPKVLTVVGNGSTGSVKLFANGVEIRSDTNFPTQIAKANQYDLNWGDHLFSEILVYEDALDELGRRVWRVT